MARILVVDDERSAREYLRLLLEQEGHETGLAGDGGEALVELEREVYALVITDLHMPEMDGFEVTKNLRASGITVPIFAMSAGATTPITRSAFSSASPSPTARHGPATKPPRRKRNRRCYSTRNWSSPSWSRSTGSSAMPSIGLSR